MSLNSIGFALIFFHFISLISHSQSTLPPSNKLITYSDPYEVVDAPYKKYFNLEDGVLSIKVSGERMNKIVFQIFTGDKLNETEKVQKIMEDVKFNNEYYIPVGFFQVGNTIQFLYTIYNKEKLINELFALQVDVEKGGFNEDPVLLLTINKTSTEPINNNFYIYVSDNKEHLIVCYNIEVDLRNEKIDAIAVFNVNLIEVWQKEIKLPLVNSVEALTNFTMDSKGNCYFSLNRKGQMLVSENTEHKFNLSSTILKIDISGNSSELYFDTWDIIVDHVTLKEIDNGDIICAGYYRQRGEPGLEGVFTSKLNNNNEMTGTFIGGTFKTSLFSNPKLYKFSEDIIRQHNNGYSISNKEKKEKNKKQEENQLLNNFCMRKIEILNDGSTILTGENFYITKIEYREIYHFDDILLTKIKPDGELDWMKKIPKCSIKESFKQFVTNESIYIVFLDNPINKDIDNETSAKYVFPHHCAAYKTNIQTGSHEYVELFSLKIINEIPVGQIHLYKLIQLTDTELGFEAYAKNKQDRMFKVKLEE